MLVTLFFASLLFFKTYAFQKRGVFYCGVMIFGVCSFHFLLLFSLPFFATSVLCILSSLFPSLSLFSHTCRCLFIMCRIPKISLLSLCVHSPFAFSSSFPRSCSRFLVLKTKKQEKVKRNETKNIYRHSSRMRQR